MRTHTVSLFERVDGVWWTDKAKRITCFSHCEAKTTHTSLRNVSEWVSTERTHPVKATYRLHLQQSHGWNPALRTRFHADTLAMRSLKVMQIKKGDLGFIIRLQFTHFQPQVTSDMIAITQRLHMLILGMIIMHRAIHLTAVLGVTVIFSSNVGSFSQKIFICQ